MRRQRLTLLGVGALALCLALPASVNGQVTVQELDIAGNPPGLEGTAAVFLEVQGDDGEERLLVAGGCMEDYSLFDQGLVLSDLADGYDNLSWDIVQVPGMGAVCEHTLTGPGDVAYLLGGYVGDFQTWRPMNEVLEVRLVGVGKGLNNVVVETTTVDIPCTDCPEGRIGSTSTSAATPRSTTSTPPSAWAPRPTS